MAGWWRKRTYPIGVDLGGSSLKMMQLASREGGLELVAAARAEVPWEIRGQPALLQEWYVETVRELLAAKPFKGMKVVTCLPAREMLVQHLRLAKMDEEQLVKALPWEAQGKVPFDVHRARLCHVVAGEVYDGSESKLEVILLAASHSVVQQHLSFIERTRLQVEAINVEPCALINCFAHLLEKEDPNHSATMFIDLGHGGVKVVITHGAAMAFCRTISAGTEHLLRSISERLGVEYGEAVRLHQQWASGGATAGSAAVGGARPAARAMNEGIVGGVRLGSGAATVVAEAETRDPQTEVREAAATAVRHLAEELRSCLRYHDLVFSGQPVVKAVFVGGQAKQTAYGEQLARALGLPAQLGDPLARILPDSRQGPHSDLTGGERHCEWAVAFGLSLGGGGGR